MPNFALYDNAGNIKVILSGTSEQATPSFIGLNTPSGLAALEIPAAESQVAGEPQNYLVQNGQFVLKP